MYYCGNKHDWVFVSMRSAGGYKGCNILSSRPQASSVYCNVALVGRLYRISRIKDLQIFSPKSRIINILCFMGCTNAVTAVQLCGCRAKAATDNA